MRSCVERGCTARRLTDTRKKIGANACGERVSQIIAMREYVHIENNVKKNFPSLVFMSWASYLGLEWTS